MFLIYERVFRTSEYLLFDPTGKNLTPQLQGIRLIGDKYVRLEMVGGKLFSERLGLELFSEGSRLTFIDPSTNVVLRRLHESNEYAKGQEQRADEERRIALAEKQRADEERRIALAEKQRADEERRIALAEKQRADDNEAIIQKLLAQLEERDRNDKTEDR